MPYKINYHFVLFFVFFSYSINSFALVTGSAALNENEKKIELRAIQERGKIEPNENRASFQSAKIDIHQISYQQNIGDLSLGGKNHFLKIDFNSFTSGEESVSGQVFYTQDKGQVATLTYGFSFVHELTHVAGLYVSISPYIDFNKKKFSVPRVDNFAFGIPLGIELTPGWNLESLTHYGSGISGDQNSFLSFSNQIGYRVIGVLPRPFFIKYGVYAELDTSERRDEKYDQAFSPTGTSDRIRSMKYGTITSINFDFDKIYLGIDQVQKLGGYDAPATNALAVSLGGKF
tara:strand:- start:2699 stop:3565 length:867 start_codon:yes stop_codon:yes gene_type:complete